MFGSVSCLSVCLPQKCSESIFFKCFGPSWRTFLCSPYKGMFFQESRKFVCLFLCASLNLMRAQTGHRWKRLMRNAWKCYIYPMGLEIKKTLASVHNQMMDSTCIMETDWSRVPMNVSGEPSWKLRTVTEEENPDQSFIHFAKTRRPKEKRCHSSPANNCSSLWELLAQAIIIQCFLCRTCRTAGL